VEIGAAELPPLGYIRTAGRTVWVAPQVAEKNAEQFLRPLDIVLIIKGSVGKVGIVPHYVPPPGPGGWVAGQSAIVLRVTPSSTVDPRTLALQLRSPFGQELLKGIVSGATIPLIQLRELTRLPVLVPDLETARRAGEALEEESRIQGEIDRLREAQAEAARDMWTL
jgi:type I restriction enzyme M protein